MGASASVQEKTKSKWSILKKKKVVLTKNALKVLDVIYTELDKPLDGSDMPESGSERLHYHSVNEVRRLRAKLNYLQRVPEKDRYQSALKRAAAARSALKRNPEKTQRSDKYDKSRTDQAKRIQTIVPSTDSTAVDNGMFAGGILRDQYCTSPRGTSDTSTTSTTSTTSNMFSSTSTSTSCLKLVPYSIFVRRAIINLPSIPKKSSDGTKSKVNRVMKVCEVDTKANLYLIENPPTRPEPNVVTVLVSISPDKEQQMLKHFPTIDLPMNPDDALKCVRVELKRQWGLDAHVLSYHADPDQETDEKGWRLFEVEAHDASWIPTRLIPLNHGYRNQIPPEQYKDIHGNRSNYDQEGHLEYLNTFTTESKTQTKPGKTNTTTTTKTKSNVIDLFSTKLNKQDTPNSSTQLLIREIEIPMHGADWMELDLAVGVGGLEELDVSSTSRDPLIHEWHEIRELRYARERQHEALLMLIQREGKVVKRSPWRQLGWYTFAVGWVDQQLSMQPKDHKGFLWQRDGPMYQITLTDTHCVFRCATKHHGDVYFSTSSKKSRGRCSSVIGYVFFFSKLVFDCFKNNTSQSKTTLYLRFFVTF